LDDVSAPHRIAIRAIFRTVHPARATTARVARAVTRGHLRTFLPSGKFLAEGTFTGANNVAAARTGTPTPPPATPEVFAATGLLRHGIAG